MTDPAGRLRAIVGPEHVLTDPAACEAYAGDATFARRRPDLVVRPGSTEETAAVVAVLGEAGMPVTARGAGTGLSAGAVPLEGSAVLALDRLVTLEVDAPSLCAVAGAGVVVAALQGAAEARGLMYPPDPASADRATVGGTVATNAGGPSCLKYGVTADHVLGLTAVLADGRVLRLGGRTRKRSAGYRLAQLFVGSEGTLGVVTEAILRLVPRPPFRATALAAFGGVEQAAAAVAAILAAGRLPAACELVERGALRFVADLWPEGFPTLDAAAVLLLEQDGSDAGAVADELEAMAALAGAHGATAVVSGIGDEARAALWRARRAIGSRISARHLRLSEDVAVPIPRVPDLVREIGAAGQDCGVEIALWGHAGDGNLHPSLILPDREPATLERVAAAAERIFHAALALGGTVSAEHGLGALKRAWAEAESGPEAVEVMRAIKGLLDPKGILNPGKVLPPKPGGDRSLASWLAG